MNSSPAHQAVNDLLHEADAAFAAGDADRWTAPHSVEPIG